MAGTANAIPLSLHCGSAKPLCMHDRMSAGCMSVACSCACVLQVRKLNSSSQSTESKSPSSSVLASTSPPVLTGSTHQFCSLGFIPRLSYKAVRRVFSPRKDRPQVIILLHMEGAFVAFIKRSKNTLVLLFEWQGSVKCCCLSSESQVAAVASGYFLICLLKLSVGFLPQYSRLGGTPSLELLP